MSLFASGYETKVSVKGILIPLANPVLDQVVKMYQSVICEVLKVICFPP